MERIARLGPYRDETNLEVFRLDDGIEIVVNERRVRLQPGDRLALHAKWEFWKHAPMAACETTVTVVRGGERIELACFEFDAMWGGWMPQKIQEELRKIGCEVELTEETIER